MLDRIFMFLNSLLVGFRSQATLQAEIIALRHQLIVLQRTQKPKRLVLNRGDSVLVGMAVAILVRLAFFSSHREAENVIGWHRQGFRWWYGRFGTVDRAVLRFLRKPVI